MKISVYCLTHNTWVTGHPGWILHQVRADGREIWRINLDSMHCPADTEADIGEHQACNAADWEVNSDITDEN